MPPPGGLLGQKLAFLTVNNVLTSEQVRAQGRPPFGLRQQLVAQDHAQIQGDADIARDKIDVVKARAILATGHVDKDVEVLEYGDDDAEDKGEVGTDEAEGGRVGHVG